MSSEVTGWLKRIWTKLGDNYDVTSVTLNTISSSLVDGTQKTKLVDNLGTVISPAGDVAKLMVSLTRPADTNNYAVGDNIGAATVAVKEKQTVTLTGTAGTLNISVVGVANRTATFSASLATTSANFITAHAAAFLPSTVVTNSGNTIIFEASTAGVPLGSIVLTPLTGDLTGATNLTTANVTLSPLTLATASLGLGGGGFIMDAKMETDAVQFAGATLRFWLFTQVPSGIAGDNVAYVNTFANADKRCACGYFDMVFDPLLAGSDCLIGKYQPNTEYVCDPADTSIYVLIQTLTAITAPKSAGVFKFSFNVVKVQ